MLEAVPLYFNDVCLMRVSDIFTPLLSHTERSSKLRFCSRSQHASLTVVRSRLFPQEQHCPKVMPAVLNDTWVKYLNSPSHSLLHCWKRKVISQHYQNHLQVFSCMLDTMQTCNVFVIHTHAHFFFKYHLFRHKINI